jgi:hypothetical protein
MIRMANLKGSVHDVVRPDTYMLKTGAESEIDNSVSARSRANQCQYTGAVHEFTRFY